MAKARKTNPTGKSVDEFIYSLGDEQVRDDCRTLVAMMRKATKKKPEMWGTSIVGFGRCYWYGAGGKPVEWMEVAFAPRKTNLTVYLFPQFEGRDTLRGRLGKHGAGKGCVYIRRLSDVDLPTLQQLIDASVNYVRTHRIEAVRTERPSASRERH